MKLRTLRCTDKDDGHEIGCMRCVRRCGVIVPHHLAFAVMGGDYHADDGVLDRLLILAYDDVLRLKV